MITFYDNILCYEDKNSSPRKVHWMDISTRALKPLQDSNVTHTSLPNLVDMICVVSATKRVLLACSEKSLEVYDAKADKIMWIAEGILPGMKNEIRATSIATDEEFVYVTDHTNACMHVFEFEGTYKGFVPSQGEEGYPCHVTYDKTRKSMSVLYVREGGSVGICRMVRWGPSHIM